MNTVIIYGIEHKGSTYSVMQMFKNKLNIHENDLTEFYLPKDLPHFCIGCNNCFFTGEKYCPHQEYVTPIKEAFWNADLIIFASPVYVLNITGQMKALLDHFAFQFMIHRPNVSMFYKTALVVTIAAGGGMRSAIKAVTSNLISWGIRKKYAYGKAVFAAKWENIPEKRKRKIELEIEKISRQILKRIKEKKISLKIKVIFLFYRMIQKKFGYSQCDKGYWQENGWLDKNRPWKNKV